MANVITLDFKDAPPAQGGGGLGDHVTPGGYLLTIGKLSQSNTTTGKEMVNAEYRTAENKRITENFVLPRPGTNDSKFPLQRFHALLVSIGMAEQSGQASLDLDKMSGRQFIGDVVDDIIPASADGKYGERLTSKPNGYYKVGSEEGNKLLALSRGAITPPAAQNTQMPAQPAPVAAAPAPAPAPAPVAAPAPQFAEPAPLMAEAPMPMAAPVAPAPVAQPAPASGVDAELDSLFAAPQ